MRYHAGRMEVSGWVMGAVALGAFVLGRVSATPRPAASRPLPTSTIDVAAADAEIVTLIEAGRTIDAIKRYRAAHGVDLKAAKDAVDALAARHGL